MLTTSGPRANIYCHTHERFSVFAKAYGLKSETRRSHLNYRQIGESIVAGNAKEQLIVKSSDRSTTYHEVR